MERDFADGRRLADAVDADDEHDRRRRRKVQLAAVTDQPAHNLLQLGARLGRFAQLFLLHAGAEEAADFLGGLHADVGHNQHVGKLLIKIVVDFVVGREQSVQRAEQRVLRLFQSGLEFIEKSHSFVFPRF